MQLISLLPYSILLFDEQGGTITLPPSGKVASVEVQTRITGMIPVEALTLPITVTRLKAVEGLPHYNKYNTSVYYVVSRLVKSASACHNRPDLLCPGEAVVDAETGEILGHRGLAL
jgi:hypothetical protein